MARNPGKGKSCIRYWRVRESPVSQLKENRSSLTYKKILEWIKKLFNRRVQCIELTVSIIISKACF